MSLREYMRRQVDRMSGAYDVAKEEFEEYDALMNKAVKSITKNLSKDEVKRVVENIYDLGNYLARMENIVVKDNEPTDIKKFAPPKEVCGDKIKVSAHGKVKYRTLTCNKEPKHEGLHGCKNWTWDHRCAWKNGL